MKIEEQVLSREQMAHLVELGIDTSDASMYWIVIDKIEKKENDSDAYPHYHLSLSVPTMIHEHLKITAIPTYTIGDLIEKLPKSENIGDLLIEFCNSDLGYGEWDCSELYGINGQQNFKDKPLKDALYNLLCWVAENHKELIK